MKKLNKFCIFMALILVLSLAMSACGDPDEIPVTTVTQAPADTTAGADVTDFPDDTLPEETMEGLEEIRLEMEPSGAIAGIFYLGYTEDGLFSEDIFNQMEEIGYLEDYPFLMEIDYGHLVTTDGCEIYCVVPADPNAAVDVTAWDEDTMEVGETLYQSMDGAPFFLICNTSDLFSNVKIFIEDSYGNLLNGYGPHISLNDGRIALPGNDAPIMLDFTNYEGSDGPVPDGNEGVQMYIPDLESGDVMLVQVFEDYFDSAYILRMFADYGVLPQGVDTNSYTLEDDEIFLDVNAVFGDYLRTLTEEQADLLLECIANNYLLAFDADYITFTEDGFDLETDYADYSALFTFTDF